MQQTECLQSYGQRCATLYREAVTKTIPKEKTQEGRVAV